ncbi:hypothetical protein PY793_04465 [Acetobacter fabarum]|uniref:hypothetical protein n=1 Tax=Acetobacter fabarum TaxID=483199 RepID=UPI00312B8F17
MKLPDGWRAISADKAPEIIFPLIEIMQDFGPEPEKIQATPIDQSNAALLDAAIDLFIEGHGDETAWLNLPCGAWRLFSEKIGHLSAAAAQAAIERKPFMIASPQQSDDALWISLLANEIRSAKSPH